MVKEDGFKIIENRYGAGTYQKYPVTIVKGEGAILYDVNGSVYIDMMGGYGVSIVGHCHPKIVKAIKDQCKKLITCHGSLYNDVRAEFLEKLVKIAPKGLDRVFLSNSGAESIECALKLAIKFTGRKEIISMKRGYHGKTLGALSTTWNPKYREFFSSLLYSHVKFIPFGDAEKLRDEISKDTAAVILEPIQGEGGIHLPPEGYLSQVKEVCEENGSLLIFDEIQTGLGRTGKIWASQHWNVKPDIMCVAKGLAGGVPIGATLARSEIMETLRVGEHTSTFGGNPLACAAASATIDVLVNEGLPERAEKLGKYFLDLLYEIKDENLIVRDVRGLGLMIGLESRFDVYNILMGALAKGVILLYAGRNTLRFLPPLVIEKEHIDKTVKVVKGLLEEERRKRLGGFI